METSKGHNTICLWYFVSELLAGATLLASVELSSLALQLNVVLCLFYIPTLYSVCAIETQQKTFEMHQNVRLYRAVKMSTCFNCLPSEIQGDEPKLSAVNACKEVLDLSPDMNVQIDKVYRIVTQSLRGFVGMSKNTQQSEHMPAMLIHLTPQSPKQIMEMAVKQKKRAFI